MEGEIDLREVIMFLLRRKFIILSVFFISIIIVIAYAFSVKYVPTYESVGEIMLGNFPDKTYTNQFTAKEILLSDNLLEAVIKNAGLSNEDVVSLRLKIKTEPVKDTNTLKVTVSTGNKEEGVKTIDQMFLLFIEQGDKFYQNYKDSLNDEMESVKTGLETAEHESERTQKMLVSIDNAPDLSSIEKDLRRSMTLGYLQFQESQRLGYIKRIAELQKEINILKNTEISKKPLETERPNKSRKGIIISVGGILGLMIGIFVAFITDFFLRNPFMINKEDK